MKRTDNPDIKVGVDERLEQAFAAANYRLTLNTQKENARLKLERDLTFSTNGGIFNITPELISFVHVLIQSNQDDAILLDVNGNPIEIGNLKEFLSKIIELYRESTNAFLAEFKRLQKARTAKALLGE